MHGEQFARLEAQVLRSTGELAEVGHATWVTADLDDVAALHTGRGDLDGGGRCTARCPAPHWGPSVRLPRSATVWQEQLHAS